MEKKKYSTPELNAMSIRLQGMIAESTTTPGLNEPTVVTSNERSDLLDGLFD